MKEIRYKIVVMLFLMTAVACHKELPAPDDNSIDVQFPYSSYIFFDVCQPTKGVMINDNLQGKTFAVTAYKYDGQWGIVSKGECLPNLFYNFPVTYVNGAHVYDATENEFNNHVDGNGNRLKLIPWEDNMHYTFYAHYPYDPGNSNPAVSSKTAYHGEPYIDFTLPDTPEDMFDLMTAGLQDEDNSVDNYVSLRMYHRLAGFDVYVSNHIQSIGGKEVSVKVKDVSVTFDNLMYSKASFWMNRAYRPDLQYSAGVRSLTSFGTDGTSKEYEILDDSEVYKIPNGNRDNISATESRSMMIIPQKTDGSGNYLKGKVTFDCEFIDKDDNPVEVPILQSDNSTVLASKLDNVEMQFNVNKSVDAGFAYDIEIAFVNGVITVRVQSAPTWDENFESNIEFN